MVVVGALAAGIARMPNAGLRQAAEELRQLRLDAARGLRVRRHQLFRRLVEEARIGADEAEELVERAEEVDALERLLHLGADALHLFEADVVDARRIRVVDGGVERDAVAVVLVAARDVVDAHGVARRG